MLLASESHLNCFPPVISAKSSTVQTRCGMISVFLASFQTLGVTLCALGERQHRPLLPLVAVVYGSLAGIKVNIPEFRATC